MERGVLEAHRAACLMRLRLTFFASRTPLAQRMTKGINRLVKSVAAGAIGVWLSACSVNTVHEHRPVEADLMQDLQSRSIDLKDMGFLTSKGGVRLAGGWNAPDIVTVPMEIRGGLPCVKCRINGGSPQWIIIDTGSQGCVLEAKTAVKNHVKVVDPAATNLRIVGVLGTESALMGIPDSLQIGDWQINRFPVLVRTQRNRLVSSWPFGKIDLAFDVVGTNIMRSMCSYMTLDYLGGAATFGFKGTFKPSPSAKYWHAPLSMDKGLPHVRIRTQGVDWTALIDTGATSVAELNEGTAKKLGILQGARTVNGSRLGVGEAPSGAADAHRMVTIPTLERIGPDIRKVPALIVGDFTKLGTGLLRRFRVTFDFRGQRLWIEDPL